MAEIPVIDCKNDVLSHSSQIISAIKEVGFVYLKNFGHSYDQVSQVFDIADDFWRQPEATKLQYKSQPAKGIYSGYYGMGSEKFNPNHMNEIREAFNFSPAHLKFMSLPSNEVPKFEELITKFWHDCWDVGHQILSAIAIGIGQDKDFFKTNHKLGPGNETTLRMLNYPPLYYGVDTDNTNIKMRCGEHSDYGSITMVFQDDKGGLEVRNTHGDWVKARPEPECVLINTGDLLQRWTDDTIKAVKHRVIFESATQMHGRRSLAYFMHPDDEAVVEPLNGSSKYAPVTGAGYLKQKFNSDVYNVV